MKQKKIQTYLLGLATIFFVLLVSAFEYFGFFSDLNVGLEDRLLHERGVSDDIVIVAIDNKSIQEIGVWPWPRSVHAKIIDALSAQKARVIGYDVTFSERSNERDDADLVRAIKDSKRVTLAEEATIRLSDSAIPEATESLHALAAFRENATFGVTTLVTDTDGVVRRTPLSIFEDNEQRDTFATQLAGAIQNVDPRAFFDDDMTYRIPYAGKPYAYKTVSAIDLINGSVPEEVIKNRIVLVGALAPDLQDLHLTPLSNGVMMPGIEVQANIIQGLLDNVRIQVFPAWARFLFYLLLAVLLFFASVRLRLRFAILFSICLFFLYLIAAVILALFNILPPIIYPMMIIFGGSTIDLGYRYISERRERRSIRSAFDRYLAPQVIDNIIAGEYELHLGGMKTELTILFSDIRSFTSLSEKLSAQDLVSRLNEYLTAMTDTVLATQGVVDKYIGDAIMAFWGAPIKQEDHVVRAATTALAMKQTLVELHERWMKNGTPLFNIGIGLNTGEVIVGNMGSEKRFDYTAIGDDVNLASRTEGLTKHYGVTILITEATQKRLDERFVTRFIDLVAVKGRTQPVKMFELFGYHETLTARHKAFLEQFARAIDLYRLREWDKAHAMFTALWKEYDDHPSALYAERCAMMNVYGPGEDWNGVYVAQTK